MERTVPRTESEEIELYTRTYYSLLRSTAQVQIRTLEEVHGGMNSLLHPGAHALKPDMSAFIYSLMRLPERVADTKLVVLGQSADVFRRAGFGDVFQWEEVAARARRRRCYYDGKGTLACLIASRSDIDDIIPLLTAYQIEWNKLHTLLQRLPGSFSLDRVDPSAGAWGEELAGLLELSTEDIERLYVLWDQAFVETLKKIAARPLALRIQLLNGSLSEYRRATNAWWENIERAAPEVRERPVYFISSNTHSLVNLLTGFALQQQERLVEYLHRPGNAGLLHDWNEIGPEAAPSKRENFLYYVYKKYLQSPYGQDLQEQQRRAETEQGIIRIPSRGYFDVDAQVIDMQRLIPANFDPRLRANGPAGDRAGALARSNALILNIDYPLGLAAYNILSKVSESAGAVLGVYVMGKAATLNGVVGDVMIPNVVHDGHSENTYLFSNCFTAADVTPYLMFGTVLDNQKAVTVEGTFLQNASYMDVFYREGYTDIEMESGAFLSAIFEMHRPTRHPVNEIVNLYGIPFDFGLIHYASDTPLSKGRNLGAGSLSYSGMESTYAATLAIARRILAQELQRSPRG